MDEKKILIFNLSKGRIGEDTSGLLGAMMITQFQLAAMSRVDLPEDERQDFYLFVDEFQNFATESFANILSEARKYRLNLIIAHQYIEQLDEKVQAAVFGNVGTIICFRVGAADAEVLVKDFTPYFTEEDLVNLAKWQVFLKLMIDGVASTPFSANILPPVQVNYDNRDKIIRVTRERYSSDKKTVEDKIIRWASSLETAAIQEHKLMSMMPPRSERSGGRPTSSPRSEAPKDVGARKGKSRFKPSLAAHEKTQAQPVAATIKTVSEKEKDNSPYKYDATCSMCGQATKVSFRPDDKRPVFCKDCLSKVRSEKAKSKNAMDSDLRTVREKIENKSVPIAARPEKKTVHEVLPGEKVVLS